MDRSDQDFMKSVFQYFDFILAASPLVFLQMAIPPLSYALGRQFPQKGTFVYNFYKLILPAYPFLGDINFLNSLMFERRYFGIPREEYRMITYMFVHGDYDHLFRNIVGLLSFGFPIFKEVIC